LCESLQVAKTEVARLDGIVSRFLRAARPAPVHLELEPINPVVEETLRFMGAEIEAAGVTAEASLAHGLPRLWLDHDQMKQVLINLIKNALHAMTAGAKLTVTTERIEDSVVISVRDTGKGIPADEIGRIFDPYQSQRTGGMGLGLMIVRRIVQQHGGAIEVDSVVGRGTVFRIRLPTPEKRVRILEAAPGASTKQFDLSEVS
jgi:signal transduction histidine kinase